MDSQNACFGSLRRHMPRAHHQGGPILLRHGNLNVVVVDAVVLTWTARVCAVQLHSVANELLRKS